MGNSIWDDFKRYFLQSGNALYQLILLNVALFVGISIPLALIALFNANLYTAVSEWLYLPSDPSLFIVRPWTIVTYMFLHELTGIFHILFNMLILFWFGRIFHEYQGNNRLIAVYVLSGLVGGLIYMLGYNVLPAFAGRQAVLVGASGAVMGVVLATATLLPDYSIRLILIGPVKLKYIAAVLVLIDILSLPFSSNAGGSLCHLGGAVAGFLYVNQLKNGRDIGGWIINIMNFFKSAFQPKPKSNFKVHRSSNTQKSGKSQSSPFSAVTQEEIDAILDKIAKKGYDSLSQREKDILFRASEK